MEISHPKTSFLMETVGNLYLSLLRWKQKEKEKILFIV